MDRNALLKKLIALNPAPDSEGSEPSDALRPEDMDDLDTLAVKFSKLAKRSDELANKTAVVKRLQNTDYSQRKLILQKLSRTFASIDENDKAERKHADATQGRSADKRRTTLKAEIPLEEVHRRLTDLQRELDELIAANKPRVVAEVRTLINEYDVSPEELGFSTRQHGRHLQRTRSNTGKRQQVAN